MGSTTQKVIAGWLALIEDMAKCGNDERKGVARLG